MKFRISALAGALAMAGSLLVAAPASATAVSIDCTSNQIVYAPMGASDTITLNFAANCSDFQALSGVTINSGTNATVGGGGTWNRTAAGTWSLSVSGSGSTGTGSAPRGFSWVGGYAKYVEFVTPAALADATLSNFEINGSAISGFSSGTLSYTATVGQNDSGVTLRMTPAVNQLGLFSAAAGVTATCTNGTGTSSITLSLFSGKYTGNSCSIASGGTSTVDVTVTSLDGSTTSAYTLALSRPAAPAQTYTVTYNVAGQNVVGTTPTDSTAYQSGATAHVVSSSLTRQGYTFGGWQVNGVGSALNTGDAFTVTTNTTLYAVWTSGGNQQQTYSVGFNGNGGTGSMSSQTGSSSAALTANAFTRQGYTFAGWNTAANGSGTSYANGATYSFTASILLYAQWTAGNQQVVVPPVDPMLPTGTPTLVKSAAGITCTVGAYSQKASFVSYSLLVDGQAVATVMTDRSLPLWLLPHLGDTVNTGASLNSATFAWNEAWAGKKLQCAVLAYANNATGLIYTDEI